jgi:hypothetical protein
MITTRKNSYEAAIARMQMRLHRCKDKGKCDASKGGRWTNRRGYIPKEEGEKWRVHDIRRRGTTGKEVMEAERD